jgi:hypothetical protein
MPDPTLQSVEQAAGVELVAGREWEEIASDYIEFAGHLKSCVAALAECHALIMRLVGERDGFVCCGSCRHCGQGQPECDESGWMPYSKAVEAGWDKFIDYGDYRVPQEGDEPDITTDFKVGLGDRCHFKRSRWQPREEGS